MNIAMTMDNFEMNESTWWPRESLSRDELMKNIWINPETGNTQIVDDVLFIVCKVKFCHDKICSKVSSITWW